MGKQLAEMKKEEKKMRNQIYFDNASTTFPKPKEVAEEVYRYMTEIGSNMNRGCYQNAYQVEEIVFETRQMLCELFHGEDCKNVIFTKNVTESLNMILKGFLKPGDHVLVSTMEHNAVMRPLVQLQKKGVSFSRIPCYPDGSLCLDQLPGMIKKNTKAVVMTHASNVCGTIMPVKEVGEICKERGIRFILDAAQTAGILPVDMEQMNIDALAFTGHKGLLGPQGIGGFLLKEDMVSLIDPLLSGGTGSISHQEEIPDFMPDRFEAGTMNLPGIMGLHASLLWLGNRKENEIVNHERRLTKSFLDGLKRIDPEEKKIRLIGKREVEQRTGVVSIQVLTKDLSLAAFELDDVYGIMTRVGLHCAPSAHKTLGTYPTGTIRFSFGYWNTLEEVDRALLALADIVGVVIDGF